jgi:hypothetical protein
VFNTEQNWAADIANNMNNAQTFEAIAYLKFLRDFEIPEDEYVPIISNERFIEWESFFTEQVAHSEAHEVLRQSQTIFHRCIFEVFLGEL